MKRPIITDLVILRQKSTEATEAEAKEILTDLYDSLDLTKGIGLASVQIGILKQVAIVCIGGNKIELINARIIEKDEKIMVRDEGCLSLPSIRINTDRYNYIKVRQGNGQIFVAYGLEAVAIQHEISHCFGRTILDCKHRAR
jgi:peptide deformylase